MAQAACVTGAVYVFPFRWRSTAQDRGRDEGRRRVHGVVGYSLLVQLFIGAADRPVPHAGIFISAVENAKNIHHVSWSAVCRLDATPRWRI